MKRGRIRGKVQINLSGLNKSEYRSYLKRNENLNLKEIILNLQKLSELMKSFDLKESVTLDKSNESIKFLNNSLKEYLKNIIQELIEYNRRRTYSKYLSFSKQNKIISYGINVQRDPNPSINAKKNKFFPQKNLTLMCTINVDKKLELLNKYNALIKKTKYNKDYDEDEKIITKKSEDKEADKRDDASDSSECDFFQKEKRKNSDEINNNKKENKGIMNVYQSHELTTNKNIIFKRYQIGHIELKDLVYYLEENQTIPLNKQLLFNAYTEMTISGNK